jgi:hypothetical protein
MAKPTDPTRNASFRSPRWHGAAAARTATDRRENRRKDWAEFRRSKEKSTPSSPPIPSKHQHMQSIPPLPISASLLSPCPTEPREKGGMHAISTHVGADVREPRDPGPPPQPMRAVVYLATGVPTSTGCACGERTREERMLLPGE